VSQPLELNLIATTPQRRWLRQSGSWGIRRWIVAFVAALAAALVTKLVVALLGVGGALTYFAPIQPVLGVLGVVLLALTLAVRLRRLAACPAPLAGPRLAIPRSRK
jgi:hypothetical protein